MTDTQPYRIMVVDDHAIVRRGIHQFFMGSPDIIIECEAASGQEALDLVRKTTVDGVLLDISMPDRSGLDVLRHLQATHPDLPVLVLSLHEEDLYATSVLKAGARGFISKSSPPEEIVGAMRAILRGEHYISATTAQLLADVHSSDGKGTLPHEQLSTRELEVFRMIARGRATGEIANELHLSAKTVATHRNNILEKMGLKTTADLSLYAIRNQLIE